jgi:hypothetical protein
VSNSFWTGGHCRPLALVDLQSKATVGTSKKAVGSHLQAGSSQPAKDGSDPPGMGAPRSIGTRNKNHACMAQKWNKTKKKTVLCIRLGSHQGRSRCLVALSKRSCSWEQDRETNGLIAALGTRSSSAAVQTIESAAESEIGPNMMQSRLNGRTPCHLPAKKPCRKAVLPHF